MHEDVMRSVRQRLMPVAKPHAERCGCALPYEMCDHQATVHGAAPCVHRVVRLAVYEINVGLLAHSAG
jgi:hypothetical protein